MASEKESNSEAIRTIDSGDSHQIDEHGDDRNAMECPMCNMAIDDELYFDHLVDCSHCTGHNEPADNASIDRMETGHSANGLDPKHLNDREGSKESESPPTSV